jgi:hypothetical protein
VHGVADDIEGHVNIYEYFTVDITKFYTTILYWKMVV